MTHVQNEAGMTVWAERTKSQTPVFGRKEVLFKSWCNMNS